MLTGQGESTKWECRGTGDGVGGGDAGSGGMRPLGARGRPLQGAPQPRSEQRPGIGWMEGGLFLPDLSL